MFFHLFIYSELKYDLQGSTLMPLFFLLSGFSLGVAYVDRIWQRPTENRNVKQTISPIYRGETINNDLESREEINMPTSPKSTLLKFFYNRFIRTMPVYYICFLLALPITFSGFGSIDPKDKFVLYASIVQSVIPTNTWTLLILGQPLDGPEWTIATLWSFWLIFPLLLDSYRRLKDEEILQSIIYFYWLQLAIILFFFPILLISLGYDAAFWWTTSFPLARLPVFVMGLLAGILCARYGESEDLPWFSSSGSFLPFRFWCCCCQPCSVKKFLM